MTTKLSSILLRGALLAVLVCFVFMVTVLFGAGAEAFLGDKEPMWWVIGGLICGTYMARALFASVYALGRGGRVKLACAVVIAILSFNLAATPIARWLIRQAYASPTNVIQWW